MPRVKTFAAGGTITAADLNNLQDDYEPLLGYRYVASMAWVASSGTALNLIMGWVDLEDLADLTPNISPRTPKLRIAAQIAVNNIGVGTTTITFGLAPLASVSGTGTGTWTGVLGTNVAGSTCQIVNPTTGAVSSRVLSSDFSIPAPGVYALTYQWSNNPTAGFAVKAHSQLWVRHV